MKKTKIFLMIAALVTSFSSCSMLEPDLDNVYDEDRLISDPAFAEGLLLAAYRSLPTGYSFNEVATDDAVSNDKGNSFLAIATGAWTAMNNPLSEWEQSYEAIAYLNRFLDIVDNICWSWQSEERNALFKSRYKGEALALRAWFHFEILKAHGGLDSDGNMLGIPYLHQSVKADDESTWRLSRPTYRATVDDILADLDAAIALLPDLYENNAGDDDYNKVQGDKHVNRINGRITHAIKARVALHAASPAFNGGHYDSGLCQVAANESSLVIDVLGGLNAITKTIKDPYFYDANSDTKNADILWRMDYVKNTSSLEADNYPPSLYGNGRVNPSQNFVDAFPMKNGFPIDYPDAAASGFVEADPYSNRDARLANIVLTHGGKMGSAQISVISSPSNADGVGVQTNSTRTGYYLKKLLRPDVTLTPSSITGQTHVRPIIRYTEMYLIYAEAADVLWGMKGDSDGHGYTPFAIVAQLRKRAKITSKGDADAYMNIISQEEFTQLLRNERRIELSFEGFRFWDLRRWNLDITEPVRGIAVTNDGGTITYKPVPSVEIRAYKPYMQFGPIPFEQTLKCGSLTQNSGWQ